MCACVDCWVARFRLFIVVSNVVRHYVQPNAHIIGLEMTWCIFCYILPAVIKHTQRCP